MSAKMTNSFELVYSGKVDKVIPVYKYRSNETGLNVVIAQVGGPLVNGYLCLATEAHDDDGLPHTLEHLVFMGSEKYPYKGVLDLFANRCLASGTNAWTDTDHTCYTMTTAGSQGFLNLLPVYLDHVLYPTLTESAYVTEVHHINGEGEDAGVVYCEMQACENTGENRTRRAMLNAMYPGRCGYKSETGGALGNLRTSTSHAKVVAYHREFYRPENLSVIVTGQVEPQQVLDSLQAFEQKIKEKGPGGDYTRPWQSPVPPLTESLTQTVRYASDDEKNGMVLVGWRGPRAKDQYGQSALMILLEYLTDTAVAPLQREFVEIEQPYCNDVKYSMIENSEGCIYIKFTNVPVAKLSQIQDKLLTTLRRLGSGEEALDLERMRVVVKKREQEAMSALEDEPHDAVSCYVIGDVLYGDDNQDLEQRLNQVKQFRQLEGEAAEFWTQLLNKYLLADQCVTILGEPSTALMEEQGAEEKARVQRQREQLGEAGLKERAEALEEATSDNEEDPPEEMVTSVDVPDIGCIHFHKISPSSNHDSASANQNASFKLDNMPLLFQLDDIQTKFVDATVLVETSGLPLELQYLLPLYCEVILESPVMRNGELVGHEQVVRELEADTVTHDCNLGISGSRFTTGEFSTLLVLYVKVVQEKYEKAVSWLRQLLFDVEFVPERLKIIAAKMANGVAAMKRSGRTVVNCTLTDLLYRKDHVSRTSSMLRQHVHLTRLQQRLDDPVEGAAICQQLQQLRTLIVQPARMRVHLSADTQSLAQAFGGDPAKPWRDSLLPAIIVNKDQARVSTLASHHFLSPLSDTLRRAVVVGVGSVESSFLIQAVPCVTDFTHPDLAAIMVFIQYLTQIEGPMWRQIRGLGLSYHYNMFVKPEIGQLYFLLYKSTHLVSAYREAKQIVESILSGETEWSEVEFESCKASVVFEVIEEEKTPSDASHESMVSYLRGVSHDYHKQLLKQIQGVTLEDLKRVGPQYIAPVFDTTKLRTAVVCHPTKVDEISREMKEGFSMELDVVENMDESFLAEL